MRTLLIIAMAATFANAGMFSVMTGPKQTKNPKAAYTVETPGFNPRVYEFTPTTAPNYTCIALFSSSDDSSTSSMQCVRKE